MMSQPLCPERTLVDRHFRGRISPAKEAKLRQHLPDCASCRARYDRHLLNSTLTGGLAGAERLAIGLGLPPAPSTARRWATSRLSLLGWAAAAAGLVIVAGKGLSERAVRTNALAVVDPDFTARGGPGQPAPAAAPSPSLHLYRIEGPGSQVAVRDWIRAADELAFAYGNPTGLRHLAVFGTDEAGHIYWFFPAWTDPGQDPLALPIDRAAHRELPEAIGHRYQGTQLRLVGLFLKEPVSVRTIEKYVRKGDFAFADLPGARKVERTLEIRR